MRVLVSVPDPEVIGRATSGTSVEVIDRRLDELRALVAEDNAAGVIDYSRATEIDYLLGVRLKLTRQSGPAPQE